MVGGPWAGLSPANPSSLQDPLIELVGQTAVVSAGGSFEVTLRLAGVPGNGSVRLAVHQRVRSRSELAQSMEGAGLRGRVLDTVVPLSSLVTQDEGTRRLTLRLSSAAGGPALAAEGVYPVELIAQDIAGSPLATVVTHLVTGPETADESPDLGVAVLAELAAPLALQPDGTTSLEASAVERITEIVAGLRAAPGVPATLAASPETLDTLGQSLEPAQSELLAGIAEAGAGRLVIARPYVPVSPDDLAPAGLLGELRAQRRRGEQVLAAAFGTSPTGSIDLAPPDLAGTGLRALADEDVRRLVVSEEQVEPLRQGIISYSLAQPFLLREPRDGRAGSSPAAELAALSVDPVLRDRMTDRGTPGLVASRVLAELALLRLEQPSVARSVVLPAGAGTRAQVLQLVLEGLGRGRPFAPMTLDDAFEHAAPLVEVTGRTAERRLDPARSDPIRESVGADLIEARELLRSFSAVAGVGSPALDPLERHMLLATAAGLRTADRLGHARAVTDRIRAVTGAVTTPETFTLTLTSREGTIPLTIRNDSGLALRVALRLTSQKVEFPSGESMAVDLPPGSTRVDLPVRTRASGAFPLLVEVTSPDGDETISTTRYTVRSTAVAGAGLVLSIGAGLFLVAWWASHWRRTRRSSKLVAAHHEGDTHTAPLPQDG